MDNEPNINDEFCLNPEFWDEDDAWKMRPGIRETLLRVRDDILYSLEEELKAPKIKFSYVNLIMTGSLCGANWDATSDVDLHFVVDFKAYEDPELLHQFLNFFAKGFNENKFTLKDHTIEIYFQDADEPHRSPGIYDVEEDRWIKSPDCIVVTITDEHREKAKEMFGEINNYVEIWNSDLADDDATFLEILRNHLKKIKAYREKGLKGDDDQYSFENIVFKLLRRNGALKTLVTLMRNVKKRLFDVDVTGGDG